jgi:hypothetical protein
MLRRGIVVNRNPNDVERRQMLELARETALHAHSYARVAMKASQGMQPIEVIDSRMPMNFLFGHACELAMKSLLLAKGYDENDLKAISHRLDKAVAACEGEGVLLTEDFKSYCDIMGSAHGQYLTRYAIRSFPWIGYEDAVSMILPQLKQLPWPWPDDGGGRQSPAAASAVGFPPDERVMGAMAKAAERELNSTSRSALDLASRFNVSGMYRSGSHLRELIRLCVDGFEAAARSALNRLFDFEKDARPYRGAFVKLIDALTPEYVAAFKGAGGDAPAFGEVAEAEQRELRDKIDESRKSLIDEFDLRARQTQ